MQPLCLFLSFIQLSKSYRIAVEGVCLQETGLEGVN
jgi:hypothetical protein